jgi:hypothetical protein
VKGVMLKFKIKQVIEAGDWDGLVEATYGKPYCFQQQDGCKPRGTHNITIPNKAYDYENDSVPEVVNGEEMGVSFKAWISRDPKQDRNLFWERNFYPDVQMIANDLHEKGLILAGDYVINIDW